MGQLPLTVVTIATRADAAEQLPAMLATLPSGCEVVVLINDIGDVETAPALDRTEEAGGKTIRVYTATYTDINLGRMRNDACALATREWMMWMDCDDRLLTRADVVACIENAPPMVGAYECMVTGLQDIEGSAVHYSVPQVRLWRRSCETQWIGRAHEVLDVERIRQRYVIGKADIVIHHVGYICSEQRQRERLARNVRGVCATVLDLWDRVELRNHYLRVLAENINAYMFHHQLK